MKLRSTNILHPRVAVIDGRPGYGLWSSNAIAAPYGERSETLRGMRLLKVCKGYFVCPETQGKTLEEVDLIFVVSAAP